MLEYNGKEFRNLEDQVGYLTNAFNSGKLIDELGIKVLGVFNDLATAKETIRPPYEYGDAFEIGTNKPYNLYIYTRNIEDFFDFGPFPAPGPQGKLGPTPSISINASVTNTTGTPEATVTKTGTDEAPVFNFTFKNIKGERGQTGMQGIQGPRGFQGPTGPIGPRGNVGPKGDVGPAFKLLGDLTSTSQLPTPTAELQAQGAAYTIPNEQGVKHIWVIQGTDNLLWVDIGESGVQGQKGDPGDGINSLKTVKDIGAPSVTYNTTNGITINGTERYTYITAGSGAQVDVSTEKKIPLIAGEGISIDAASGADKVTIKTLNANLENGAGQDSLVQKYSGEVDSTHFASSTTGESDVCLGEANTSSGKRNILGGKLNENAGSNNLVGGLRNNVSTNHNVVVGQNNVSNQGHSNLIGGMGNTIDGYDNIVSGGGNTVSENCSSNLVVGEQNILGRVVDSIICGDNNNIKIETLLSGIKAGTSLLNNSDISGKALFGHYNSPKTNTLVEVGNGTSPADINRKNAFEVLEDGRAKVQSAPVDDNDAVRKQELDNSWNEFNLENGTGTGSLIQKTVSSSGTPYANEASGSGAVAMGKKVKSNGNTTFVTGQENEAIAGTSASFTSGRLNVNRGSYNIVGGENNANNNSWSLVIGKGNAVSDGRFGIVSGLDNVYTGPGDYKNTTVSMLGNKLYAQAYQPSDGALLIGRYNDIEGTSGRLFVIGNGTSPDDRKNAFEVLENGRIRLPNFDSNGNKIGMVTIKVINGAFHITTYLQP